MNKEIHYKEGMDCCPYCGHNEFYIKQYFSGTCDYNMRFDRGVDVENGSMWDGATMKDMRKYVKCSNCNKKLFPIDEYYKALYSL